MSRQTTLPFPKPNSKLICYRPVTHIKDLSSQLLRVSLLVADGLKNQQIADRMHLSEGTVRVYTGILYEMFHLKQSEGDNRVRLAKMVWEEKRAAEDGNSNTKPS